MARKPPHKTPLRRLVLLRHAKSAWPEAVADHDRPLAGRGRKAVPLVGDYMAREGLIPDLVLVSTARRAQETWECLKASWQAKPVVRNLPQLYGASADGILNLLHAVEPSFASTMIVGHNPELQALAVDLCGKGDAQALAELRQKLPTAGLVIVDFDADRWENVSPGEGRLERFVTPRSLG